MSQEGRFAISYTERSEELEGWLTDADLLVISNNKAFDATTRKKIVDRVGRGMPMMIYHPSTWYNWKRLARIQPATRRGRVSFS